MRREEFIELLETSAVVAAIKDDEGLRDAVKSDCAVVFILYGDLLSIREIVDTLKAADKIAMVHLDLVGGLAPRDVAVDFIASATKADGIISTKPSLVRHAKALGLLTVQRFFLLDSMAIDAIGRQLPLDSADVIEVLPGAVPKVIRKIADMTGKPIVAGGLIFDKEDVLCALQAGACAISTSGRDIWAM